MHKASVEECLRRGRVWALALRVQRQVALRLSPRSRCCRCLCLCRTYSLCGRIFSVGVRAALEKLDCVCVRVEPRHVRAVSREGGRGKEGGGGMRECVRARERYTYLVAEMGSSPGSAMKELYGRCPLDVDGDLHAAVRVRSGSFYR
jgi:hypothetical protein